MKIGQKVECSCGCIGVIDSFKNDDYARVRVLKPCKISQGEEFVNIGIGRLERNILAGRIKMKEDKFEKRKARLCST